MAYEKIGNTDSFTFASTGIRQYRAVRLSTSGAGYPSGSTVGLAILGVVISSGSVGSTRDFQIGTVQLDGVAKMEAEASTSLLVGALVSASSVGRAQPATNVGDFIIGRVVSGSSGAANTVISVALQPLGSTVAPT